MILHADLFKYIIKNNKIELAYKSIFIFFEKLYSISIFN